MIKPSAVPAAGTREIAPDARHRETEVFAKALALPTPERAAYLATACGDDAEMRKRIEALLRVEGRVGDFLEDTAQMAGVRSLLEVASRELAGRLGRYKLLEKIGEGGCGVIYLAEQAEPVRRQVALKVIKPGMGTKDVIARFEVERQALALMDHPGIAKVFDAGETDSGQPYFVMELIRGVKITEYCDQHTLTTRERLELFIRTCEAVQHAHQKGVIHRDIKPSNILVTATPEGVAQPVIIDFGIAKATNDLRLTDKTLFTAVEMLIGTPTYMSPEQTALTSTDVDTRTDIYSLGVLLYELLTGFTPFDAGELLQLGIDEIRHAIREQEPPRPSARLGKMSGETLTGIAKNRLAEPRLLIRSLCGDLDWIVMKSLEKDRTRRYPTAHGLALDIVRHLNHEPVNARPPSSAYRLQKAIRRNKLVFGAATAIVAALVAGIVVSTSQMLQARKAQQETEVARNDERRRRMEAQSAEKKAQAQTLAARRISYSSDMTVIEQALRENNLGRARQLLERHKPQAGELDLRDWEWRYLWGQARADEHEVFFTGPRRTTRPLTFSADGRLLARTLSGTMVVNELASRRVVWERPNVSLQAFAHRAGHLAYVSRDAATKKDSITLWDSVTRKETEVVQYDHRTEWIAFTPDDQQLLTVSIHPKTIRTETSPAELTAWDVATGRLLWQRTIGGRPPWMRWRSYTISPDGKSFAATQPNGVVQVFETKNGDLRFTITTTEELSICVMFSPDSTTLLTGSGFSDPVIRLWDARSGEARGSLKGHDAYVTDLLFTPDGSRLISSGADQTIRLWNWTTRQLLGVFRGHLDEVDGIALTSDGQTLASYCKDGSIYLWDLNKTSGSLGYHTFPSRLRQRPHATQFTPDSRSIVGIELNNGIGIWDVLTGQKIQRLPDIPINTSTGISPDAKWIASIDRPDTLRIWEIATGRESARLNVQKPNTNFADWKFADGGKRLVTLSGPVASAVLEVWDTATWSRQASIPLHFKNLLDYSTSFEPKSFASAQTYVAMADGVFRIFDLTKLSEAPRVFRNGFAADDWAVSPDGRKVAAANSSGVIRLWSMDTLDQVATLKSFRLGSHSVTFSPDGRRLAAGSNGREAVRLWDVATLQEVLTLNGQGSRIAGLKFSPDERHLMAVNDAGVVHIWTAPTWEEIAAEEAKSPAASGADATQAQREAPIPMGAGKKTASTP